MTWRDDRIGAARRGENPTLLRELSAGYAVIGDVQFLPGYCVLLGRDPDVHELAELPRAVRLAALADVDLLATAVARACRRTDPEFLRMNIEILGNADAFVHAHLWPRYRWEPDAVRTRPVWLYPAGASADPAHALGSRHDGLRAQVTPELDRLSDGLDGA